MATDLTGEVLEEIHRIIGGQLEKTRPVHPGDHLVNDLGLDSLDLTILAVGLEDRFHVRLSEDDSTGVSTVADLAKLVARRAQEAAS